MNNLSPEERGYIAGLIDGEGSISIQTELGKYSGGRIFYRPCISIVNTDRRCLDYVREVCGYGYVGLHNKKRIDDKRKASYIFSIRPINELIPLLKQITYLLRIKREQAELLSEYCESRLAKNGFRNGYTKREIEIVLQIRGLHMSRGRYLERSLVQINNVVAKDRIIEKYICNECTSDKTMWSVRDELWCWYHDKIRGGWLCRNCYYRLRRRSVNAIPTQA